MSLQMCVSFLLFMLAAAGASVMAQNQPVTQTNRDADAAAIRAHIGSIFQAFMMVTNKRFLILIRTTGVDFSKNRGNP